eukprot:s127_g39.t1
MGAGASAADGRLFCHGCGARTAIVDGLERPCCAVCGATDGVEVTDARLPVTSPTSAMRALSRASLPTHRASSSSAGANPAATSMRVELITADGRILDVATQSLLSEGLKEEECLTAVVLQAKLAVTRKMDPWVHGGAFALWCCGGNQIVAWGSPNYGGDSSAVQDQLRNVQQVQGTFGAFAAILADGSVVTWGHPSYGGDSSAVQNQLRNVQQVQGTHSAFAATLADGSVVTWGNPNHGGDSSAVQDQLRNVQQVQGTYGAFAAILADGSVVTWGNPNHGGDSSAVQDQLRNVQQVQGTHGAFAAILADGSVVTWGNPDYGCDSSAVQDQLRNVQQVQGTHSAFAAILADGSVVTWGHPDCGANSSAVQDQLRNVQQVQGTHSAFAAILADGSVVTWGHPDCGANSSAVRDQLRNVQQVEGTHGAFAAILADGSVVTWGHPSCGGDSSAVQDQLRNVQQVQGTYGAFAAILADGSVVTWGHPSYGGDSSAVQDQLYEAVISVHVVDTIVLALLSVSVVALERPEDGGLLLRVLPNVVARPRVESEPGNLSAPISLVAEDQDQEEWELPPEPACDAFVSRLQASTRVEALSGGHCVICAEDIVEHGTPVVTLNCQHHFHEDCIRRWLTRRHTCPTCRMELEVDDVRYLRSIGLKEEAEALEKVKRERLALEQQQQAAERRRWVESMRRGEAVHFGLACGACSISPMVGECFRCKDCEDFVICSECHKHREEWHAPSHQFTSFGVPCEPPPGLLTVLVPPAREASGPQSPAAEVALAAIRSLALAPLAGRRAPAATGPLPGRR